MTAETARSGERGFAPRLAVATAFLVGFLWQVLGAVSNLLAWVQFAVMARAQLSAFAWIVLIVGLLIPAVLFVAGLIAGRRSPAGVLALILLLALGASAALSVSQLAFFQAGIGAL